MVTTNVTEGQTVATIMENTADKQGHRIYFSSQGNIVLMNNCTNHHIFNDELVFISPSRKYTNIVINKGTSSSNASLVEKVRVILMDGKNAKHTRTLQRVIYLLQRAQNLGLTPIRSHAKGYNCCCILSRDDCFILF